jgi:sugar phosphate permease
MWNIAHNLGGFAAPILAGTAARTLGWNVSYALKVPYMFFLTRISCGESGDCGPRG